MRTYVIALGFGLVACGGGGPIFPSDDIAEPFDGGGFDATFPKDGGFPDAATDAADDATKYVGGPFLCDECVCDGTLDMCLHSAGGAQNTPVDDGGGDDADFGDASACMVDAGYPTCRAIPIDCLPNPTCACILTHYPAPACSCDVDPTGDGFRVTCNYP
jgi:hypothetical protein